MPNVTRSVNLTEATVKELTKSIRTENFEHTETSDLAAIETLKEINQTMKIIKEQNDEIIGDEF